ncbi:hypothetical protein BGX38DRAFT_856646 [Terfezia claveryi]|nr:hypothetical protein BGX38DRAFT_856646 [Terfezia claveryi]
MQLRRRRMVEQSKGKCLARDRRNCTLWISYFKQRDKKRLGRARPSLPTIFSVVLSFLPVNQFIPRSSMVTGCMVCLCVLCFLRCIFSSYFARQVSYNTSADLIIVVGGPWRCVLCFILLSSYPLRNWGRGAVVVLFDSLHTYIALLFLYFVLNIYV